MGQELELFGPFEIDPVTGQRIDGSPAAERPAEPSAVTSELPPINA
jgi:hypothetical protein